MYRKALTSDSLSTHGFFGRKTSHPPLYRSVTTSGPPIGLEHAFSPRTRLAGPWLAKRGEQSGTVNQGLHALVQTGGKMLCSTSAFVHESCDC